MSTLIVVGGYAPSRILLPKEGYERIIAADSGYDTALSLSLKPDFVVGDFDSTSLKSEIVSQGFKAMPRDKDYTDTELALKLVEGPYDLLGGGEGRMDHLLAIIALFKHYGYPKHWFMRQDTLISLSGKYRIRLEKDSELSFFSPYGSTISTKGLVWDMDNRNLDLEFISLSNRMKENEAVLESVGTTLMRIAPENFTWDCVSVFN